MQTDNGTAVDLTNCDREPIHLLGAVQPFGFLLAVSSTTWCVTRASRNVVEWLGVEAADLLGRPLDQIFTPDAVHTIRGQLQSAIMGDTVARAFGVVLTGGGLRCDVALHVMHDTVVIEGEPCVDDPAINAGAMVRGMIARLQQTSELRTFYRVAAREMRAVTGFDRVMIYRFDHDGSGEVIAESARAGLESYLGLHYPASDIPRQARILYERNWLRIIPDVNATPAAIEPQLDREGQALDLSMSILRSVSPIHVEYLQNMGVAASMSVSILRAGQALGTVRLPPLCAAPCLVRAPDRGRAVRTDVLAADGEPRARQRERVRSARAEAAPSAHHGDGERGDAVRKHRDASRRPRRSPGLRRNRRLDQ